MSDALVITVPAILGFICGWLIGQLGKREAIQRAYSNGWRQCRRLNDQISESKAELEFYRPNPYDPHSPSRSKWDA